MSDLASVFGTKWTLPGRGTTDTSNLLSFLLFLLWLVICSKELSLSADLYCIESVGEKCICISYVLEYQ